MAVEVMATKIKWEMRSREDRKEGEEDEGRWTEAWEVEKLEEREIFSLEEGSISQSLIISREGLILTLSILPCPQGRIF